MRSKSPVSFVLGVLISLFGMVVLAGWHTHASFLVKIVPVFEPMKYNTALGFLLSGAGLAFANLGHAGKTRILGVVVALLGGLTQMQNAFSLELGIDQLFMNDYLGSASLSPGRMSPITAVCFVMMGLALFFLTLEPIEQWFLPVGAMSTISLALCITALLGYIADIEATYRWENYVSIAMHTAVGFTILGAGIMCLCWSRKRELGFPDELPVLTVIFFSIVAFRLHQAQGVMDKHNILPDIALILIFLMGLVIALVIDFARKERLQASEIIKLSHAIEHSPVSVVITDKNGVIEYVNNKFSQVTGYAKEEVTGKNPRILKSGEQSQGFYRALWDRILSGKEWQGEFRNKKKNGEIYWENTLISSVKNVRGEITQFVSIKEDITEKKRILEALAESEEKYRQFFATCSDAIILFDRETNRIVDANDATLKLYQYSREEFLRLSVDDLSDDKICCVQQIAEIQNGDVSHIALHYHNRKDGSKFPVESVQGSFTAKGRKIVFCLSHDISHRLEEEQKLRNAEKAAQLSDKLALLGTMTANVCHEALNPLNIISMHVQLLLKREKDNPALTEKLMKISDEIKRVVKIMGTFMIFSRKPGADSRTLQINAELESVLALVEKELTVNNIKIVRDYQDSLPDIKIEPDEMRQVFLNLVNNAKYAMKHGGSLILTTRAVESDAGNYLRISVSDTGCGIKKENLTRIFEPFFTTKPEGDGTGIGLSMVYTIIDKHGGRVRVESEEGKGTSFIIDLPVKNAENTARLHELPFVAYPELKKQDSSQMQ